MTYIIPKGSSCWIRTIIGSSGCRQRLFAFPHAGGSASLFGSWAGLLPPSVQLCAIELPGRGARMAEPCRVSTEPLVKDIVAALAPYLDLPFSFFGTSYGALLAYDVARHLCFSGGPRPVKLFVAARQAPDLPERQPIHHLDEEDFIAALRSLGGIPSEILDQDEVRSVFLPALRADFTANETYSFVEGPPLPCPISVFGGRCDSTTSEEDLGAWRPHTRGAFRLRLLDGDHFFPFSDQGRPTLIAALAEDLNAHPLGLGNASAGAGR